MLDGPTDASRRLWVLIGLAILSGGCAPGVAPSASERAIDDAAEAVVRALPVAARIWPAEPKSNEVTQIQLENYCTRSNCPPGTRGPGWAVVFEFNHRPPTIDGVMVVLDARTGAVVYTEQFPLPPR